MRGWRSMATPPTDYQQQPPREVKPSPAKTLWLPIATLIVALVVPTIYLAIWGGTVNERFIGVMGLVSANAQDIEKNGEAISTTPSTFVPRAELDAKLDNIQLQVQHTNANVESLNGRVRDLAAQSTRDTAAILRSIERNQTAPP